MDRLGFREFFGRIETGSNAGSTKASQIRDILREWGIPGCDVACVGDDPQDIYAARDSGAIAVGAAWAQQASVAALETAGAVCVFESAVALLDWLRTGQPNRSE